MRTAVVWIGFVILGITLGFVVVSTFQTVRKTETGLVVSVDSAGLTNVLAFTIRTDDGRTVKFRMGALENAADFAPAHLLEHRATGIGVVVTYREENGELVAVRIDDGPAPSSRPSPSAPPT